ncbi:hypothetical protein F0562_005747 [Nyssa sinensis]|uniref:AIPP2-like SPOC-like domain-containing protein n=1 Tax=Nyssa sinensis TaxID=561372 RepID=A0A5J5ALC1_9ASTE|nr:hypothetical protein F0562_005747 [Nyssa sinensis]
MASSSSEFGVRRTTVCQTCGDNGDMHLLIYCMKCQDSAVHHYCLDKFSPDDDEIAWMCEECAPKFAMAATSRKSGRINLRKGRALEVHMSWKKRLNKNSSFTAKRLVHMKEEVAETAQLADDCSLPYTEIKNLHSCDEIHGSQEPRKQRRRLLLIDEDSPEEEFESVKAEGSSLAPYGHYGPLNIACSQMAMESDNYVPAQPIMDPIWRGRFSTKNETHFGLMAHLSSKACSKVSDATNLLPPVLDMEILPRCDAWPKTFQRFPPTDDWIALYFFPEYERDEKVFDHLLDEIIELNLALKAVINDVELLVFSSLELPQQHWRFRRKYYMWGVFRKKRVSSALVPTSHSVVRSSNGRCVTLCKGTNQAESLAKTMTIESPHSHLSNGSSHASNPSYSPFLPKATYSSPHLGFDKTVQGYHSMGP